MKCHRYTAIVFTTATLFCVLSHSSTSSHYLEQEIEQQLNVEHFRQNNPRNQFNGHDDNQHLKRKRRYLEFPEGSSFQLVYDLIVGVVDFTNYLILGVTVALAWELPSKPPSEIFNDLTERLKDGTLGTSRNDTAENIKYLDLGNEGLHKNKFSLKPMFRPPMHYRYYTPGTQNGYLKHSNHFYKQNSRHNLLYTPKQSHPFIKKYPKFIVKGVQYPWWNLHDRLKNSFVRRPSIRRFDKDLNGTPDKNKLPPTFQGSGRSEHRIYPVFGKRSSATKQALNKTSFYTHTRYKRSGVFTEVPSKLERIHIEHHRRTRHDLYQRIETYLNGRGSHGHHCVLKALCETGQKSSELHPASFVGELMRAIFTIPEPFDTTLLQNENNSDKTMRYDAANKFNQDCSARYTHCKESLWSSHFVL